MKKNASCSKLSAYLNNIKYKILIITFIIICSTCKKEITFPYYQYKSQFTSVCNNNPLNDAAIYNSSGNIHKIVVMDYDLSYNWELPESWRPQKMNQVELLACCESIEDTLSTCHYKVSGSNVDYTLNNVYIMQSRIIVHEAATGNRLDDTTLYFSPVNVPDCPANETFISGSTTESDILNHDAVMSELIKYLKTIVEK